MLVMVPVLVSIAVAVAVVVVVVVVVVVAAVVAVVAVVGNRKHQTKLKIPKAGNEKTNPRKKGAGKANSIPGTRNTQPQLVLGG